MISKQDTKTILIITFVIIQLLSMIFNMFFTKITIGNYYFTFNYSVVFFCIGFFIVDIVNDQFSANEAEKFFYYKLYSQILFLLLSYSAINIYGLNNTLIAKIIYESPRTVISGLIAYYFGFKVMNKIMSNMGINGYQGRSVFRRYLYSTLPGEVVFSFVFTLLSFSKDRDFDSVIHIFTISCMAKIILSIIFSAIINFLYKFKHVYKEEKIIFIEKIKTSD